ncbi:MAG: hypothetical protein WAT25_18695 [Paracoccaceae bacterium]
MPDFRPVALALCLAASPALADPASDYDQLRKALPTLLFGTDVGLHMQSATDTIRRLEGRWFLMTGLMEDGVTFPEDEYLAIGCDKLAYTLAADGLLGLTLTFRSKPDPLVITMHYAGGNSFVSSFDDAGMMSRFLGEKPPEDVSPNVLYSILVTSPWQGYISLIPAGKDLILLQPLAKPPELLVRCP